MGVDKTRQQCALPQIHHPRRIPSMGHHVVQRSGGRDRLAPDRHRFDGWLIRIHGDDVVAEENKIRGRTLVGRGPSTATESVFSLDEDDEDDEDDNDPEI